MLTVGLLQSLGLQLCNRPLPPLTWQIAMPPSPTKRVAGKCVFGTWYLVLGNQPLGTKHSSPFAPVCGALATAVWLMLTLRC